MNRTGILVFGYGAEELAELSAKLDDSDFTSVAPEDNRPSIDALHRADILVCRATSDADDFQAHVLWPILDSHPYLPVVIVGAPPKQLVTQHTPGGVFYLPPDAKPMVVAVEIRRALEATWWKSVARFNLPLFVVDADGLIRRANDVASRDFRDVIGQPYREAVERATTPAFPQGHPIEVALSSGKAVSQYFRYSNDGASARWAHLVCRPLFGITPNDERPRAVAVLFRHSNRWADIVEASSEFHKQETVEALSEKIVEWAQRLGFARARLYRFDERTKFLYGCACRGLSESNAEWFCREFRFPAAEDAPTKATLDDRRELPWLFIKRTDGDQPPLDISDDVSEHGLMRYGRPREEARLEMEHVARWIEAPLFVPKRVDAGNQVVHDRARWGKLCVDLGERSADLSLGDAMDIALFANAASSAIVAVAATEREQRDIEIFERYSQQLARADWRRPERRILNQVIELLSGMYRELTGADVVFFRRLQGKDTLELQGEPSWREACPWDCKIPTTKRNGEGISCRILQQSTPQWGAENHARHIGEQLLQRTEGKVYTPEEANFIRRIGSELYLPISVHGELRGVIVAVAYREEAYSGELAAVIERFAHLAPLWFELGELHDAQHWTTGIFAQLIEFLPDIADALHEHAMYAVVAALLSAHDALGWNRVFIWACRGRDPTSAELVYALGGCGEESQGDVRTKAEKIKIRELVEMRLEEPAPRGKSGTADEDQVDSLYQLVIAEPNESHTPLAIAFGHGARDEAFDDYCRNHGLGTYGSGARDQHPLRRLLELDFLDPANGGSVRLRGAAWFDYMNEKYPEMFCNTDNADRYAFPLWRTHEGRRKPLGLVVVDMYEHHERPIAPTVPATSTFLDLVSDIVAFRDDGRFIRGYIGGLPAMMHHGLRGWEVVHDNLRTLVDELQKAVPAPQRSARLKRVLENIEANCEQFEKQVADVRKANKAVEWSNEQVVEDLYRLLQESAARWQATDGIRIRINWCLPEDLPVRLDCPAETVRDSLQCLVENARAAVPQAENVEIRLTVRQEDSHSPNFIHLVVIEVTDLGPGLPAAIEHDIFMDGYTHDVSINDSQLAGFTERKGRGLSTARAQLLMYHAELKLIETGPRADPLDASTRLGATFHLRFGISRNPRKAIATAPRPRKTK